MLHERKFRFWCQKVLPLVYDDSLSYYELLCKVVSYINSMSEDIAKIPQYVAEAISSISSATLDTADELLIITPEYKTYMNTRGFHSVGDTGACMYYITNDYNDVVAAKYYLAMEAEGWWAIPVLVYPVVTPEMFGAYGDGEHNDTLAISTAITKYKNVQMSGRYLVDGEIEVDDIDGINVTGGTLINPNFVFTSCNRVVFDEVQFENTYRCFSFHSCSDVTVSKCKFSGNTVAESPRFVEIFGSENIDVVDCVIFNAQYGVFIRPDPVLSNCVRVLRCKIYNQRDSFRYPAGLNIGEGSNILFESNEIHSITSTATANASYGIYLGDQVYNDPTNIKIINNNIYGCYEGIRLHYCTDVIIQGNTIDTIFGNSINLTGLASTATQEEETKNIKILENILYKTILLGGISEVVVAFNTIKSRGTNVISYGIHLAGSAAKLNKKVSIINNIIIDINRAGIYAQWGEEVSIIENNLSNTNIARNANQNYSGSISLYWVIGGCISRNTIHSNHEGIRIYSGSKSIIYDTNNIDSVSTQIVGGYTNFPNAGVWYKGQIGYYTNPETKNCVGFICTASGDFTGTAPTFANFGALIS